MKRIILLIGMVSFMTILLGQAPQAFKYQSVVRDKEGQVVSNQNINLQISILQSSLDGPEVYREIHSVMTNEFGLVNIEIGKGKNPIGSISSVDWGSGNHFLRLEMDMEGGSDYELMGVSQLLSVPYALYAEKAGSGDRSDDYDWEVTGGNVVTGHGGSYPTGNVGIGNNTPGSLLYVAKNMGEPTITIRNLGGEGGATYSMIDDLSGANWKFKATMNGGFKIRDHANSLDVFTIEPNSAANSLHIKTGGNIGIGTQTPNEKLEVEGKVRSNQGFNINGTNGIRDTINQVIAFDFANDKLKYKTSIYDGGILTYISEESGWVDSVGSEILPWIECGDQFTDLRNGKAYPTVMIGTQCWMAENLNVGTKINSNAGGQLQMDNDTIEKYCYDNDESQCDIYGGLYEWDEAMQYVTTEGTQGICPDGWHVPTDAEWDIIVNSLGGSSLAGGKMKSTGTIDEVTGLWMAPNTGATNESGFTGLPGGYRDEYNGLFVLQGSNGYFRSSTESSSSEEWRRRLAYNSTDVNRYDSWKIYGFSVRCLKDSD